jgi:hypothetical protein
MNPIPVAPLYQLLVVGFENRNRVKGGNARRGAVVERGLWEEERLEKVNTLG